MSKKFFVKCLNKNLSWTLKLTQISQESEKQPWITFKKEKIIIILSERPGDTEGPRIFTSGDKEPYSCTPVRVGRRRSEASEWERGPVGFTADTALLVREGSEKDGKHGNT